MRDSIRLKCLLSLGTLWGDLVSRARPSHEKREGLGTSAYTRSLFALLGAPIYNYSVMASYGITHYRKLGESELLTHRCSEHAHSELLDGSYSHGVIASRVSVLNNSL